MVRRCKRASPAFFQNIQNLCYTRPGLCHVRLNDDRSVRRNGILSYLVRALGDPQMRPPPPAM